jgi:hypothetical protein
LIRFKKTYGDPHLTASEKSQFQITIPKKQKTRLPFGSGSGFLLTLVDQSYFFFLAAGFFFAAAFFFAAGFFLAGFFAFDAFFLTAMLASYLMVWVVI